MKTTKVLIALLAGMVLLAGSAFAGPVWKFGPDNQGLLKLEYKGQFQLVVSDDQEDTEEFNFRRNRLALMGAYGKNFGLYVQTEYNEDNALSDGDDSKFQILDAVARFKVADAANVWVGKFKYNFTRENLEACEKPLTLDRSLFIRSPFVTTRDKGVALWGNLLEDKFQYRVDVMNGRSDADAPDSGFRYSARAHVTLLDPEKGYGYNGTYLGKKKVLTLGAAYQYESDVAFAGTDPKDLNAWTADLFFEYPLEDMGTITFSSAYVDYDMDDAYKAGSTGPNASEKNGTYVKAGYLLPNLPLQFFARYEDWSFAKLNDIDAQELTWLAGGFNYYIKDQNLKLTVEFSNTDYDKEEADLEDFSQAVAQMQLIF
nr:selenite/tellurite reduction operon porin ExtI [uncultured Desulfuromonas sp.]